MRHISSTCGLRRKDVFVCWSDRLALLFVRIGRLFSDCMLRVRRLSRDGVIEMQQDIVREPDQGLRRFPRGLSRLVPR
jgi:hypothetical protein